MNDRHPSGDPYPPAPAPEADYAAYASHDHRSAYGNGSSGYDGYDAYTTGPVATATATFTPEGGNGTDRFTNGGFPSGSFPTGAFGSADGYDSDPLYGDHPASTPPAADPTAGGAYTGQWQDASPTGGGAYDQLGPDPYGAQQQAQQHGDFGTGGYGAGAYAGPGYDTGGRPAAAAWPQTGQWEADPYAPETTQAYGAQGYDSDGAQQFGTGNPAAQGHPTAGCSAPEPGYDAPDYEASGYGTPASQAPGPETHSHGAQGYPPSGYETGVFAPQGSQASGGQGFVPQGFDPHGYSAQHLEGAYFPPGSEPFGPTGPEHSGYDGSGPAVAGPAAVGASFETRAFESPGYAPGAFDNGAFDAPGFENHAFQPEADPFHPPAPPPSPFPETPGDHSGTQVFEAVPYGEVDPELADYERELADIDPDAILGDTESGATEYGDPTNSAPEKAYGGEGYEHGDGSGAHGDPAPPCTARSSESRSRRRSPAKRSALLTVAVPSVCVMGVAGVAAASVGGVGSDDKQTTASAPHEVMPSDANNKLDSQLDSLSADAGDFADRASRTQERIDLKAQQDAERKKQAEEAARKERLRPKFVLPVTQRGLSAYFGQAGVNWMSVHTGIDFPVAYGTQVMAVTDGTVQTQYNPSYGNMAIVTAKDGTQTLYCHLSSYRVSSGTTVKAGDVIAFSGNSGNTTGPHLHFEVRPNGGTPIDPLPWLRSHGLDPE